MVRIALPGLLADLPDISLFLPTYPARRTRLTAIHTGSNAHAAPARPVPSIRSAQRRGLQAHTLRDGDAGVGWWAVGRRGSSDGRQAVCAEAPRREHARRYRSQ